MTELNQEQIEFACDKFRIWVETCQKYERGTSPVDIDHSALLRRLLAGKPLLENPPPLRFAYPAWEMVEQDEVEIHEIFNSHHAPDKVVVDQSLAYEWEEPWKILKHIESGLRWEYSERECKARTISKDPKDATYIGKFLKRIKDDK
jgi:hypothetical protein